MKQLTRKSGQGMTEYIIIIAIIAIGAILIVGIFGSQIKEVFSGIGASLGGQDKKTGDLTTKLGTEAAKKESMDTFDDQAQKGQAVP